MKNKKNNTLAQLDHEQLPTLGNKTALTLIARDPHWVYAYWSVTPSSLEQAQRILNAPHTDLSHCLRIYDVAEECTGDSTEPWFDINLEQHEQHRYIQCPHDNHTYYAELGIKSADHQFTVLARSNPVKTPRADTSPRREMIYLEVTHGKKPKPYVYLYKNNQPTVPEIHTQTPRKASLSWADTLAYLTNSAPLLSSTYPQHLVSREHQSNPAADWLMELAVPTHQKHSEQSSHIGSSEKLLTQPPGASSQYQGASEKQLHSR